ncbi:peptidoglycan-associated lipoprotein [Sphingomonas naasensis]|uniref:Peptidoglycan-associated lipoprotein n=1 Tax=Sphingomonas naasensis TaxID=1344951 RepID=A0A4S1WB88_9SPHN|nr:peptidoglycan-associated lipoprotein Pal [Sphingomonas naasensis]NIJ19773.1 peptidoglycan-associated lipoprotein [Sphingomonas naasensis]TGX40089.1 peptidoglycan-associated lipoprotein Pal [Sphingomonas naasensis]
MAKMTTSLVLGLALVATAGCAKKRPAELPPAPTENTTPVTDGGESSDTLAGRLNEQFKREVTSDTIHFALDQYDIDSEARGILDSQAAWLVAHAEARITIEGHADERGTREYNLGLGDRRANAAKNYLAARGVSPTRITTISYGKERPIALGSDEASWAQNRRAVTIVIN